MSIVAGPPLIHNMMADLWRFFRSAELAARALVNEIAGSAKAEAPDSEQMAPVEAAPIVADAPASE